MLVVVVVVVVITTGERVIEPAKTGQDESAKTREGELSLNALARLEFFIFFCMSAIFFGPCYNNEVALDAGPDPTPPDPTP